MLSRILLILAATAVLTVAQSETPEDPFDSPVTTGGSQATSAPAADQCQSQNALFNAKCLQNVQESDEPFCSSHARQCGRAVRGTLCNTHAATYSTRCGGTAAAAGSSAQVTKFCADYRVLCGRSSSSSSGQPQQPTTGQQQPQQQQDPQCSNPQYQTLFGQQCVAFKIDAQFEQFCATMKARCQWSLGTPFRQQQPTQPNDDTAFLPPPAGGDGGFDGATLPPVPGETTDRPRGRTPKPPLTPEEQQVRATCKQHEENARLKCFGSKDIKSADLPGCNNYVRECLKYYQDDEPLRKAASLFNGGISYTRDNWGVSGIPYYPFNPEGAIGGGKSGRADFGSWGGGYSGTSGVRDFWQKGTQSGGNWLADSFPNFRYDGAYGHRESWEVPILPFVNGQDQTRVDVPINERTFGQPIGVERSRGVGPFWNQGDNVDVDWKDGNVATGRGWNVPLLGDSGGFSRGANIGFPSVGDVPRLSQPGQLQNQFVSPFLGGYGPLGIFGPGGTGRNFGSPFYLPSGKK